MDCNLSEIVTQTVYTKPLIDVQNRNSKATITVRCEEIVDCKVKIKLLFGDVVMILIQLVVFFFLSDINRKPLRWSFMEEI